MKMCTIQGGGGFAPGIFRCGKFHISNVCEISHSVLRPLCEINSCRNLAILACHHPVGASSIHQGSAMHGPARAKAVAQCLCPRVPSATSASALGTHCLVFFAAGSLSMPLVDMEAETGAETDTEIDATDELLLEIAGDEKKRNQFQNLEGKSQHFVLSVACSQTIFYGIPIFIRLLVVLFMHEKNNFFMRLMGRRFEVAGIKPRYPPPPLAEAPPCLAPPCLSAGTRFDRCFSDHSFYGQKLSGT